METMFWVWLSVIVVALVIEIATLELVSVWFSIGAVVPFILAAIGGVPIEVQVVVFVVVSALLIIFLRKIAQKWLLRNANTKTNIDVQIGKIYRLLDDANFEKNGSIKINDVVWTAVSENGELIEKGQLVEIVKVDGNKMIVKKVEQKKNDESQDKSTVISNDFEKESEIQMQEMNAEEIKLENNKVGEEE